MRVYQATSRKPIAVLAVLAGCVLLWLLPLPAGLSQGGRTALLVVALTVALWLTEIIPPALTALVAMALLPTFGVIGFARAVSGFGDTSVWLLFGVFVVSAAVRESGLDRRIAFGLLRLARGNVRATTFMIVAATLVFIFLLPTSAGRAALMTPICAGIIQATRVREGSNTARAVLLTFTFVSLVSSMGVMTGAMAMVLAAGIFDSVLAFTWTYLSWLKTMFPAALLSGLAVWGVTAVLFPPEVKTVPGGTAYIEEELRRLGRPRAAEWKAILFMCLLIGLWVTEKQTGLSVAHACLLVAILLTIPRAGLVSWRQVLQAVPWQILILLGASLSVVKALTDTGAVGWVADAVFRGVAGLGPVWQVLLVTGSVIVLRLGFPNNFSVIAVALPLVFTLAPQTGLSPVALGLICVAGSVLGLFFPSQAMTHLTTYSTGLYRIRDMLVAGVPITLLVAGVILLMAFFYWPLVGVPLLQP